MEELHIEVSFLVEQAKTLPLPFLAKEGKTTSVAIFCALVSVQLTRVHDSRYMGFVSLAVPLK